MSYNKFTPQNNALVEKVFRDGLSSYTQTNCQVTLTDKGYRIYRPPNYNPTNNGNTMWGGLIIRPFTVDPNFLIKNHTYIVLLHVEGQSSNTFADVYWSNNAGWGGSAYGLTTELSNVAIDKIPSNFQGEYDFSYKFTVAGDVWKECTKSYSNFVAGTSYNCYRDMKVGFTYTDTGALGTDLYITNLRCYDITTADNVINFAKTGIITASEYVEGAINNAKLHTSGEVQMYDFIEY